MAQWKTSAGPRQTKATEEAIRDLKSHGGKRVELRGFVGGETRRQVIWSPFGDQNPAVADALHQLGERYGWTITAENHRDIIAAAAEYVASIPIPEDDCRISAEEQAAQAAAQAERNARETAERDARRAFFEQLERVRPKTSKPLYPIVASLDVNQSDSQTDYFAHTSTRHVVIGWRTGSREDFRQLRAAAARFPETAHLGPGCDVWRITVPDPCGGQSGRPEFVNLGENGTASVAWNAAQFLTEAAAREFAARHGFADVARFHCDSVEHRENWSMGGGNYLKADSRHASGWSVRSYTPGYLPSGPLEIAPHLLAPAPAPAATSAPSSATDSPADVPAPAADGAPSWCENTEKGGVEIRFPAKPPARILDRLKEAGFRWSRFAGCWWHKKTADAVAVAVAVVAELTAADQLAAS